MDARGIVEQFLFLGRYAVCEIDKSFSTLNINPDKYDYKRDAKFVTSPQKIRCHNAWPTFTDGTKRCDNAFYLCDLDHSNSDWYIWVYHKN